MTALSSAYESLLGGARLTISFPSKKDLDSFHAQLRTIKSRYEKKYNEIFSESLAGKKVIRTEIPDPNQPLTVVFFLGESVRKQAVQFTILSTTQSIPAASPNE